MSINGKIVGKNFPLYRPRDKWHESVKGDNTCERTFRGLYARWRLDCPAFNSRHPDCDYYLLVDRDVERLETNPLLCDVILRYEWDLNAVIPGGGGFGDLPETVVDENGTTIDIPIEQHPKFNDETIFPSYMKQWDGNGKFIGFWSWSSMAGITKFWAGSKTASITEYGFSPLDPLDTILGKMSDPGHGLGGAGKWIILTYHRGKQGIYYTRTSTYLFSALGWPESIYNSYDP